MFDESHASLTTPPPLPDSATVPPARQISKIRWAIHLAIMASLPLLAGFAGPASRGGDPASGGTGPALGHTARAMLIVCAIEVLLFAIPFGIAWLFSRATKDDLLLRWRPGRWVLPLGALYSIVIRMTAGIILGIIVMIVMLSRGSSPAEVQKFAEVNRPQVEKLVDLHAMSENHAYYWLSVFLVSFVVGGLREELWRSSFLAGLRSLAPRTFGSNGGGIAAAAIAALFFGAGHYPQGIFAAALITVVGFLLGVIMTIHRSVWPSIFAHGFFDATSLALLPWAMHLMQELPKLQPAGK